jgi:hypothetical protein
MRPLWKTVKENESGSVSLMFKLINGIQLFEIIWQE